MALKQGKKQVGLQSGNISLPQFPTTTITAQIAKPISEIVDTFQKKAETDARIGWQSDFNQKTRDYYLQLQEKFEFDPEGMKNSIDTYSKTLLKKTPNAYKEYAQNVLAQKNLHNLSYATSNYNKFQDTKAENDYQIDRINLETDVNNFYNIVSNDDTLGIKDINLHFDEKVIPNLNQLFGSNQERLVNTKRKTENELDIDISKDIQKLETNRIFQIATNLNDIDSIKYLNTYSQGNDPHSIKTKNVNDPIFQKYINEIKDPFVRDKIIDNAKKLLKTYRGEKIEALDTEIKFDFERETELGGKAHFSHFINGANNNISKYITENYPNENYENKKTLIKHFTKIAKTQTQVALMKNEKIPSGLSNDQMQDAFKHLLFEFDISQDPSKIMDVTHPKFLEAKRIFEKQGFIPTSWKKHFNSSIGKLEEEAPMKSFKKKMEFYNQIQGEFGGWHTDVDTSSFLYFMSNNNALSMSDGEIIDLAKKWNNKDEDTISKSIEQQINLNVEKFEKNIDIALDGNERWWKKMLLPFRESVSRDLSFSTILGKGNKYSKVLFPDSFHWFASNPFEDMADGVKNDYIGLVKKELKFMALDSNVNVNDRDTLSIAAFSALNKSLKADLTPSKYTKKSIKNMDKGILYDTHDYSLTKHGIENEFGFGDSIIKMSIMPTFVAWYQSQSKEDIENGLFGIDKNNNKILFDDLAAKIKDGSVLPAFEPTGKMINGKMSYSVSVSNGEGSFIKITEPGEYFQPDGWENVDQESKPSTQDNVANVLANENITLMEEILGEFKPSDNQFKYLMHQFAAFGEKSKISLANFSWMMDFPLVDDVPNEIKPFKILFNALGRDVPDLDKRVNEIAIHNKKQADRKKYIDDINNSSSLDDNAKLIESIYPPHEQKHTEYANGLMFQHYATKEYNNKLLPLTQRTNNLLGIKKEKFDNSLDIVAENNTAVFAHPKDSIKESVKKMISLSTIVGGDNKTLNDEPTLEELFSKFDPNNKNLYLSNFKNSDLYPEEIVNFRNKNQMSKIIKIMIKKKLNSSTKPGEISTFDTFFPSGNMMLDIYINEGVTEALNVFAGKWGKN